MKQEIILDIKKLFSNPDKNKSQITRQILRFLKRKYGNEGEIIINELTPFLEGKRKNLPKRSSISSEILYCIINNLKELHKCEVCKVNVTSFCNIHRGYKKY